MENRTHPTAIVAEGSDRETSGLPISVRGKVCLGLILVVYLLIRVPVAYLQPTGQDEDFYVVPGLTILKDGIPRLPHVRTQNEASFF